ncbi:STAS domain-containing protein [Halomonas campisalis]|uniref:STAS domain-containing protein n=1 Tax=Billgrantia campisalis TaxID=74661 RepID=A0ABS9P4C8_9GAMM|nr:STAS domain-containing protein [Halomonas campisalis]MCG6656456.1 STAS domain-containing protein [Halomonas campisalis]MDR5861642.1 STAS domain-containing protein [Halomonas campisalis]
MSRLLDRNGVCLTAGPEGLAVSGEVDFDVAALLAETGTAWLAEQPAGTRVTLDLRGVDRVSSAALSVLLEWTRRARVAGVQIERVLLSSPLLRLTRVAGLDALLPVADSPGA